jgi:hypothetical protein
MSMTNLFRRPSPRRSAAVAAVALATVSALTVPAAAHADASDSVSADSVSAADTVVFMSADEYRADYTATFGMDAPGDLSTIPDTEIAPKIRTADGQIVDTTVTTPGTYTTQSLPGDGGGPSLWFEILWQQTDKKGRTIPTRYGNSALGFSHYADNHNLYSSAPFKVISHTTNPYKISGAHIEYQALAVQTGNASIKMKIRIVAQAATSTDDRRWKTSDGKYIGTITAYCEGVTKCPAWVNALK